MRRFGGHVRFGLSGVCCSGAWMPPRAVSQSRITAKMFAVRAACRLDVNFEVTPM